MTETGTRVVKLRPQLKEKVAIKNNYCTTTKCNYSIDTNVPDKSNFTNSNGAVASH